MGQYYRIINVDKRQQISAWPTGNGAKLMEWSYDRNCMNVALMKLMQKEWKGDRVYVVGDYADLSEPGEAWCHAYAGAMGVLGCSDIYGYASENFEDLAEKIDQDDEKFPRYIVNLAKKVYIDMNDCPIEWVWLDGTKEKPEVYITRVAPLPLLLAMGNDRGGGDFRAGYHGFEYVGSWCDDVTKLEIWDDLPLEYLGFKEFAPDFTELKRVHTEDDLEEMIRAASLKKRWDA